MPNNSNPRTTADWQAPRLKRLMSAGESAKSPQPAETYYSEVGPAAPGPAS